MIAIHQVNSRFAAPALLAILTAIVLSPLPVRAQLSVGNGSASGTSIAISDPSGVAASSTDQSVAIGERAQAAGPGAVAIGSTSLSTGNFTRATAGDTIAIGTNARATGIGSAAYGLNSAASGLNAVAVGVGSVASGDASSAFGNGAQATALNSVAIGSGSVANQANTISVGSAGAERRVTNVAAGVAGTDAVNVNQLNAVAIGGAGPQVDALTNRVGTLENRMDEVARNSYRGIAGVAAMAVAIPSAPGKTAVNMGVGAYEGFSAVGASVAHLSSNGRYNLNGGLSYSGGKSVARVGVGFSF